MNRKFASLLLICAISLVAPLSASAVTIQWSLVGNPGNAADPTTGNKYGGVGYNYNIGTYDVTVSQYVEFLNTKDAGGTNTLRLYNLNMGDAAYGGIKFNNGNLPGSMYSAIPGREFHPANTTSWNSAIRFANWLNNGQGTGDTETGAYTLGPLGAGAVPLNPPLTHNAGAKVWLPTENEWYKAAYFNPNTSAYNLYPTSSSLAPTASGPTALANHANYGMAVGNLTDVGAYSGTTSPYGAFDMGGNVYQWTEALISGSHRGLRGGSLDSSSVSSLLSSFRGSNNPSVEGFGIGFRVASVPEPSSFVLAALGLIGLVVWKRRKR